MFETIPKIRLFINLLLILEIFIGLALIAVAGFYQSTLGTFFPEAEVQLLSSKFFSVYILGLQLVATFLCGLSMWTRVWPRRYSENVQLMLCMWLIFCFLIVACGCATIWMLWKSCDALAEGAEIILLEGIDIYCMNPEWKLLWDKLQYTKECCGVHSYHDWMQATWMSDDNTNYRDAHECEPPLHYAPTEWPPPTYTDFDYEDLPPLPQHSNGPKILAPYACCKHNSMYCYENYMPYRKRQDNLSSRLPNLNLTDINVQGCLPLFRRHLTIAVDVLFVLILVALFIDFMICCLTKYLMATNYKRSCREFINDSCMFDDEGNALVIVKCPPNVRCIALEEPNTYSGSDIPNLASSADLCPCCSDNHDGALADVKDRLGTEKNDNATVVH